jgi:hypothetical protein
MNGVQLRAARKRVKAQLADIKVKLAKDIKRIITERNLTQFEASMITGEPQSQFSSVRASSVGSARTAYSATGRCSARKSISKSRRALARLSLIPSTDRSVRGG